MKKVFLILLLLNNQTFAKEKLRGQLGVKLGDNVIEAIGNEDYKKFEVTYDPKFRKDYQQFEFLTADIIGNFPICTFGIDL